MRMESKGQAMYGDLCNQGNEQNPWACGAEQNSDVHNRELLREGAASESVTNCEVVNEEYGETR